MSTPGNKLTRAQGKVAVLALGYNGGINSLRAMRAEGTDRELQFLVDTWRLANPRIKATWDQMGKAFKLGGPVGKHLRVEKKGDDRMIRLPSGRAITYHKCKWDWVETQYGPREEASFADPKPPQGRARTYGGRLMENATQAVARDVMAEAIVRLHGAGYSVVGHVHDEILVEGRHSVEDVREIMNVSPPWAVGLPIDSAGFQCNRYKKG
jgi:DNA polymerase